MNRKIKRKYIIKDIDGAGYLCKGDFGFRLSRDFKDSNIVKLENLDLAKELVNSAEVFEDLEKVTPVIILTIQEIYE